MRRDVTSPDSAQYTRMAKAQRLYYHDNEARSSFITIDNEFDIGGHLPLSKSRRIFCREHSRKEKKLMAVMNTPAGQVPGVRRAGVRLYRA